jgi:hypothetical protein
MYRVALAATFLTLATTNVIAQTDAEYVRLRQWLGVPSTTAILPSSTSKLPAGAALKIYLATGDDEKARQHFAKSIDKLNQNEGKQFSKLEIVTGLEQADLIIARYKGDKITEKRDMPTVLPPTDPTRSPASNAPTMIRQTVTYRPLYVYLIVRTPDALEVAYQHVDRSLDEKDPDGHLFAELKKKIKRN